MNKNTYTKFKGSKNFLVESCKDPVVLRNLNFLQPLSKATEKTMFCFVSVLYWTENKKFVDVLPLDLLFSSSQNVVNILPDPDKIPPRLC